MHFIVRHMVALVLLMGLSSAAYAQEDQSNIILADLNIELLNTDMLFADSRSVPSSSRVSVPNIPDSAFEAPGITENNLHMYLGLASMAMGALAGITAPEDFDPDLLNSVHFKAAKASWQLGAAAIGTGFYSHWDDFSLEDGLFDRDNLHILLGLAGTIGYYMAVKGAVDEYNDVGYPSEDHSTPGMLGGAAMLTAIVITW